MMMANFCCNGKMPTDYIAIDIQIMENIMVVTIGRYPSSNYHGITMGNFRGANIMVFFFEYLVSKK